MAEAAKDDKPAAKLAAVPKPRKTDGDAGSEKPATALKQKMLATALSRAIVLATLIAAVGYNTSMLFSARYQLIQAPNTNNNFVYRLDRLTGGVQFCGAQQCVDVALHAKQTPVAEKAEK